MQDRANDMTKRMTISVDDDVYEILEKWADEEVRTVANLAAALVTLQAREKQTKQSSKGK
jgi:predicted CopG family antitoxin